MQCSVQPPKPILTPRAGSKEKRACSTQEPYLYAVAPLPTHVQVGPATVDAINAYLARIATAIAGALEGPVGALQFRHVVESGGSIRDVLHLELTVHGDRVIAPSPSH